MATTIERTDTLSSDTPGTVTPMEFPKETPPEMMPILTLLHSHQQREYNEGYLMILNDLNSGKFFHIYFIFFILFFFPWFLLFCCSFYFFFIFRFLCFCFTLLCQCLLFIPFNPHTDSYALLIFFESYCHMNARVLGLDLEP